MPWELGRRRWNRRQKCGRSDVQLHLTESDRGRLIKQPFVDDLTLDLIDPESALTAILVLPNEKERCLGRQVLEWEMEIG